ncbi:hypothetical protein E2C01_031948 [Portunus trituberculatus]|uniref:Uncharacterized protein n=1 Tax=Portunus trituberculatus TaxID=210409 RepID=A0A5B7EUS4_PORTR|nr:hypothetical protein [Portunus trituberculatus]
MQSTISVESMSTKSRWEATPRYEFMDTGIEGSISMSWMRWSFKSVLT